MESRGMKLRELMTEGPVLAPCVYDCLSARIVETEGFKAMCLSGGSLAAAMCGVPDIGLVTLSELESAVRHITECTKIPMIVDIDTGFGNELNIIRTCRIIAAAGAAGVHIEDQTFPKRCPTISGATLIDRDEFLTRIKAAVYGLQGTDCMLIARTDANSVLNDLDEAIWRCNAAHELGAECSLIVGLKSEEQMERVNAEVKGWKMYDLFCSSGCGPRETFPQLADFGFRLVTVPMVSLMGATMGITEFARSTMRDQSDAYIDDMIRERRGGKLGLFDMLGINDWYGWEKAFEESRK